MASVFDLDILTKTVICSYNCNAEVPLIVCFYLTYVYLTEILCF